MRHIERIVWKPIDWYPESPDQYPDGLPRAKPEGYQVQLDSERMLLVGGLQMAPDIEVRILTRVADRAGVFSDGEITVAVPGGDDIADLIGRQPPANATRLASTTLHIPANKVHELVDALLYVHRRTREHEYQGPDDGLPPGDAIGDDPPTPAA